MMPTLLKAVVMRECQVSLNAFSASIDMIVRVFFLWPIDVMDYISWYLNVEPALESTLGQIPLGQMFV